MADLLVKYPEQLTETLQTSLDGGEVHSKEVEVDDPGHRCLTGEAGKRDLVVGEEVRVWPLVVLGEEAQLWRRSGSGSVTRDHLPHSRQDTGHILLVLTKRQERDQE